MAERIAAVFAKLGIVFGVGTAGLSWLDDVPSGVWVGLLTCVLSVGVQAFFRALADRRDRKHKELEAKLRRIEHDAFLRRYSYDTQGMPLEPIKERRNDVRRGV